MGRLATIFIFLPALAQTHAVSQRNYNFSSHEKVVLRFAGKGKERDKIQFPTSKDLIISRGRS